MKIVILGGGISGLLAAYALRKYQPSLLEARPNLGGDYTAGGLKYIRSTSLFEQLLDKFGVRWTPFKPKGALYLDGQVHSHPDWMAQLPSSERDEIQMVHWMKTRGTHQGFRADCMNDPMGEGGAFALKCDHEHLINELARSAAIEGAVVKTGCTITGIRPGLVQTAAEAIQFDWLINTLSLGVVRHLAPWAGFPPAVANKLTIMNFTTYAMADAAWDYIYCPKMETVSRIVNLGAGRFQAESPGDQANSKSAVVAESHTALRSCLNGHRLVLEGEPKMIPGHLKPLPSPLEYPPNWLALGRFAEWQPRATAEKVLNRVTRFASEI